MLVLFETPAGLALFKVLDEGKLKDADDLYTHFETPEAAGKIVKLKCFDKFKDTTDALAVAASVVESKVGKNLKKFLKSNILDTKLKDDTLAVCDSSIGKAIKEKMGIECVANNAVNELIRGIRMQMDSLLDCTKEESSAMQLGLAHSLSRYKLKFSPDKVDTMIVQAIGLLDDLDKELNTYAMRLKEWFGWHFPEIAKIVVDNIMYAKTVKLMGVRTNCKSTDFSDILPEEMEEEMKEAAEISMGTEISGEDVENIGMLCDQVVSLGEYRTQLYDYLKNRMQAVAPNLTVMVGELVGARLIAHAGSLMNLAKHPASTVQILGAEKALFRALKTKQQTPKYGLIYHASLVGQAQPKHKGKISRVLAAKCALSIRVDALGDNDGPTVGFAAKAKVEERMRQMEGDFVKASSSKELSKTPPPQKAVTSAKPMEYNSAADSVGTPQVDKSEKKKKKKKDADTEVEEEAKSSKKSKGGDTEKKKKRKAEDADEDDETKSTKKKKKKKSED